MAADANEHQIKRTLVQMQLSDKTINRVNKIKQMLSISNRTQIIAQAVALYELLLDVTKEKGKIFAEYPDGRRERLIINN